MTITTVQRTQSNTLRVSAETNLGRPLADNYISVL